MDTIAPSTGSAGLAYNIWIGLKPASFARLPPTQQAVRYRKDRLRGVRPLVDIYVPDSPAPAGGYPSVLLIHGGAFLVGSRRMKAVRFVAKELCAAGYVVGCPDYRLIFRGGRLVEQLADLAAVRAFWETQQESLGLDPGRVSAAGLSAGGALMLLHAAADDAPAYHRLVSIYGLYDFAGLAGAARPVKRWLTRSRDPETWYARSPLAHATGCRSPLFVVHGTHDTLVKPQQAEQLVALRREAGLPTEFQLFEGMRHGWLNDARLPESAALAERVSAFLDG